MDSSQTDRAITLAQEFARRHRVGLVTTTIALLSGFAITAVAVAPLMPDAALLPQRLVSETVVPEGMDAQLTALAAQTYALVRSDVTRGTDTADGLLARLGVRDPLAAAFLRGDSTARRLLAGRGKMVQARTDSDGSLQELVARFPADNAELAKTHFTRLTMAKIDGRWLSRQENAAYGAQQRLASGTIRSTLFAATDESGLPDSVSAQLAEMFATDIDFHRELRKGDTFSVVYQTLTADGEPVAWNEGAGRVLAAEFVNNNKPYRAVWFNQPGSAKGAYYDVDGRSKRRSFLASPMEFSRVTSGFAMRFHPLLQNWRAHLGVDYGAPQGTPVRAVGEGVVEFAGRQNGYGNVVQLRHANNRSTLYAHLSRIDVRQGQRIDQGQNLGAVGMTGWATGPHLHFEFRVNGQHQDPLRVAKASETVPLDAASRGQFAEVVSSVRSQLAVAETLGSQRAQSE